MQIYIAKCDQQTGPFSTEQLESMLNSGMIALDDLAWHDGLSAWQPLHHVLNIAPPSPLPPVTCQTATSSEPNSGAMFLYISTARLIVMSLVSLGIYQSYWIYRNWRYLKERDGLKIQPFLRGFFGLFYIYSLLKAIKTDKATGHIARARFSPGGLAADWIILLLLGNALGQTSLFPFGLIISLLTFACLLPVQKHINRLNEASSIRPAYYPFSGGHIVCLVIGIISWIGILTSLAA